MNSTLLPSKTQKKIIDNAWLELDFDINKEKLVDWLPNPNSFAVENPHLDVLHKLRNPAFLSVICDEWLDLRILPLQAAIMYEMWTHTFPMLIATRGGAKTFMLGLYAVLRCLLIPNTKVVFTGSGFRQAKFLFDVSESIWNRSPIVRDIGSGGILKGPRKQADNWTLFINDSTITAIPLGDGLKIRGLRANLVVGDEFASINPDIYETVVQGFASVSQNPIENVQLHYRRKTMQEMGLWSADEELSFKARKSNQSIIAGTCDYEFKHFARYWKNHHAFITSQGDVEKLGLLMKDGVIDEAFDHTDYTIIRIPHNLYPEGYLDAKHIARQKATARTHMFLMEYGAVFVKDSDGFFKRTLIESCVGTPQEPIMVDNKPVFFNPRTTGDPNLSYVFAIDPAYQDDNFSLVIIELHQNHRRIVYCWTTSKKKYQKQVKAGLTENIEFYAYCARKIRTLMGVFPCLRIGVDSQGGGYALAEALQDPTRIDLKREHRILPVILPDKEQPTDREQGLHILELINFADQEWTGRANHGMKMDMQDKTLLFPYFDNISLGLAAFEEDEEEITKASRNLYDNLQDCILEIEDMKDELATIVLTQTKVTNRDRWDTPDNLVGGKRTTERLRKDRYSALLIANMLARIIQQNIVPPPPAFIGSSVAELNAKKDKTAKTGQAYVGNAGFNPSMGAFIAIPRR